MRRFCVVLALLAVSILASCQTLTVVGKSVTVEWDPVEGVPTEELSYEVYVAPYPGGLGALFATTTSLFQEVALPKEGKYRVGVRAKRKTADVELFSSISWSDVDGAPAPWYLAFYESPPRVQRIRVKP